MFADKQLLFLGQNSKKVIIKTYYINITSKKNDKYLRKKQ